MGTWVTKRLVTIFAVVSFLLGIGGQARALYVCQVDRVARTACCCSNEKETPAEAALSAPCCCTVEVSAAPATGVLDRLGDRDPDPQPLLATVVPVNPTGRPASRAHVIARVPRPPDRSSLLLAKQAFLL